MSSEPEFGLTPREQEVVECLVQGLSNREIEDKLGVSARTVKFHLFRIFEKTGVSSRVELLLVARPEYGNTPCPFCSGPLGEDSHEQLLECFRKGIEKHAGLQ